MKTPDLKKEIDWEEMQNIIFGIKSVKYRYFKIFQVGKAEGKSQAEREYKQQEAKDNELWTREITKQVDFAKQQGRASAIADVLKIIDKHFSDDLHYKSMLMEEIATLEALK